MAQSWVSVVSVFDDRDETSVSITNEVVFR
jgi:hypothetical protein